MGDGDGDAMGNNDGDGDGDGDGDVVDEAGISINRTDATGLVCSSSDVVVAGNGGPIWRKS